MMMMMMMTMILIMTIFTDDGTVIFCINNDDCGPGLVCEDGACRKIHALII
jgi:hypothetical protein